MEPRDLQIPPPGTWQAFEDLVHALFTDAWGDPNTQKNGRQGQPQHGVDIFGSPGRCHSRVEGVQCKGKDGNCRAAATVQEIDAEIAKAEGFRPGLAHWTFATTAPSDGRLQEHARLISVERVSRGTFPVTVLGWQEIALRLCGHPMVLERFYPQHAFDVPGILARLEAAGTIPSMGETPPPIAWHPVEFKGDRDLGPALLGRPLGPSDATACPRLDEADTLLGELLRGYSARLVGDPGGGKSVCAYQTAGSLEVQGWKVLQLDDPRALTAGLPPRDDRTLFIVDDVHLAPAGTLAAAERAAGPGRLLLSVHNGIDRESSGRGAVVIERRRAVRTIAEGLRTDPRTLAAVRRVDDCVGELPLELDLGQRIDHAQEKADYPWQFCFIMGGGWRRAERATTAARAVGAAITFAAIAIRQLASRDARPPLGDIVRLAGGAGVAESDVRGALEWLARERLIVDARDLRCPHQRFAAVVLAEILDCGIAEEHAAVAAILRGVFADATLPLAGLYVLLHELRFGGGYGRWTHLVAPDVLESAIERAWSAETAELQGHAAFFLAEANALTGTGPLHACERHAETLVRWLDEVDGPSALGLAHFVNDLRSRDKGAPPRLFGASNPERVAAAVSSATPENAYQFGQLAGCLWIIADDGWKRRFGAGLRRNPLVGLAANWPEDLDLYGLAGLCAGLGWQEEAIALDMVEAALPHIRRRIAGDPARGFQEVDDIASRVLRVHDVLGVYKGRIAPRERHRALARAMVAEADPERLALQLSQAPLKLFQSASFLLRFLLRADPARFRATVACIDWQAISRTLGEHWRHLPHEAEVLFGVMFAAPKSRPAIRRLILDNLSRVDVLPARLACMAPDAAERILEHGRQIGTASGGHVCWDHVPALVEAFADQRPDLLDGLLAPLEAAAATTFSRPHPSWYRDAGPTLVSLRRRAPQSLARILARIDPVQAEVGWTASLNAGGGARRAVAHLVTAAVKLTQPVGDLARRLRTRFPEATRLPREDLTGASGR